MERSAPNANSKYLGQLALQNKPTNVSLRYFTWTLRILILFMERERLKSVCVSEYICMSPHFQRRKHSRRRKRGWEWKGPPTIWEGANIPFAPPPPPQLSTHLFLQFLCETGNNHKCTKLKGKIIINVTLIWFEDAGKTIPLYSILDFSIISDFKMRNAIIWY